jgi:branched-chain amino acid transport system substrate-binding protein
VSVRDAFAGGFIVQYASALGYKKIGLLLERTGWGRSNEAAAITALSKIGEKPVGIEWFNWGAQDLSKEIKQLVGSGAEAIFLVANPREGGIVVNSMATLPEYDRRPIISHWGISGGDFFKDNQKVLREVDLSFLQTFSFFKPKHAARSETFFVKMKNTYSDIQKPEDVLSPVGAAHAYDLVHLLAKAIKQADSIDRPAVRTALENLSTHSGLMKDYAPAFTSDRHDALNRKDFIMTYYDDSGVIRPVGSEKHGNQ